MNKNKREITPASPELKSETIVARPNGEWMMRKKSVGQNLERERNEAPKKKRNGPKRCKETERTKLEGTKLSKKKNQRYVDKFNDMSTKNLQRQAR